ncbi:MAG TPA: MerR family transcriptional regulator [Jatrophihabitans sp.]|nr:MerR family transcriptional regulator [Jatrophihabitans sp.]
MTGNGYSIGEVAALAHVSIRTLHHYDDIGLLNPSARTVAGHRRYAPADLERLRSILFYRELDFGLAEIAAMLTDPGAGTDGHLRAQHRMLRHRIERSYGLLAAVEKEIEARQMGLSLTPEEQFEVFGSDKFTGEYAREAEQRWADTDAWKESQRRTSAYTKEDWLQIKAEADGNVQSFAAALRAGEPADGQRARELAEQHRRHLSRWFYECSPDFHRCLAAMYVSDERFRKNYDDVVPGLAQYVHDAIVANADAAR